MAQQIPVSASLQLTAEQLKALVECAQDLSALLAADGTILHVNAAFVATLGIPTEELLGTNIMSLVHPSGTADARQFLKVLAEQPGGVQTARSKLHCKDGSWRIFEAVVKSHLQDPAVGAIAASFRDITELFRMEKESRVISDVIHALNESSNLDELLSKVHEALSEVLYAENCFIALHDPSTGMFHFPFMRDKFDTAPPPQKIGRSCTAYVFRTGRARIISQTDFDRLAEQGEVELVGSPSPDWLGVPLKTPKETIGVLVVQHYEQENVYSQRDLEFLESVGGTIALAIERRRAEDALRKSESTFRLLFDLNPLPTWVYEKETMRFVEVNEAAIRLYGYAREEFLGMTLKDLRSAEEWEKVKDVILQAWKENRFTGQWKQLKKNGQVMEVESTAHEFESSGKIMRLVVARDITEQSSLEQQLRQAQKMEAVGRLAGGVAHDFNNLLMVVKGHTELLLGSLAGTPQLRKIEQIDRAADRAVSLTRQLLAFSRMQVLQPRMLVLNEIVEEMAKLLPRMIGEDIELVIRTAAGLGTIRADASQIEQVLMNLAVNARDAMPSGGRLTIETCNAELDDGYHSKHPSVHPGRYVQLSVTDTGMGMDTETQAHIFEPFFTTKELGKGTGLGLATVYGVVKQSGGFIWVYSELGKGTSFKIYLPRLDAPADKSGEKQPSTEIQRGTETILLAEDEQDVREVAREFLESAGYTVLEAKNGKEALQLAAEHQGTIDLLVTDMVMPGMTGQELAAQLRQKGGTARVVYMSGYAEQAALQAQEQEEHSKLLTKPFSRTTLLRTIREVITRPL
jgi:hypothetical protein